MSIKKTIAIVVGAASIALNIVLLLPSAFLDFSIWRAQNILNQRASFIDICNEREWIYSCYDHVKDGWKHLLPKKRGTLVENLKFELLGIQGVTGYIPYTASEEMWLQYAIYKNCIITKDTVLQHQIEELFDSRIINIPITLMSQSQVGMLAIELYKNTHKRKYKNKADEVFHYLLSKVDSVYGVNYGPELIEVDENGMVVPFLAYYSQVFKNPKAYDIAINQIDFYSRCGTDTKTGMPSHAINSKEPFMLIGEQNWGRGVAWWVIGLSYINRNDLSTTAREQINKLNTTLLSIYKSDASFSTLIRQSGDIDLSATLPILYFFVHNNSIRPSKELINQFSVYMHDGLLYNCSGPKAGLTISEFNQPNPLAHAFLIQLINDFLILQHKQ